jgi:OOP family OmpA-OmpF porin
MTRMTLLAATVLAAPVLLPGLAAAQPVTGLYIGGAGGGNFMQREFNRDVRIGNLRAPVSGSTSFEAGAAGVASIGYGFGNGLRVELEGDYRYNKVDNSRNGGALSTRGREDKYGGMVNALFDLDVGSPYVFPYIGAGAGYSWVDRRTQQDFGFGQSLITRGVDSSFAYQAIAGLSFPVPPVTGLSVTAEYRYFALAEDRTFGFRTTTPGLAPVSGRITTTDNYNHSLMLGLRYAFNVAPPPVEAPPAAVRNDARTYLVFFDWDRADLTDRARQIVAEAAQATTRVQTTRIEVAGHTDSSGTVRYNAGLSVRRAQNVAAELVRLGVPRAAINVQGFGESQPLVQTAKGVREPQNRRVEIVLR